MFKRIFACVLIALVALTIEACSVRQFFADPQSVQGSGQMSRETRPVTGFDRIRLTGLGSADIQVGEVEGLTIEAEDNILPYIETSVRGGELVIAARSNANLNVTREIHYTIQVKSLAGLDLSGAYSARVSGAVRADSLRIVLDGAGSLTLPDLQAGSLYLKCGGTSCARIAGRVDDLKVELVGTGDFAGADLKCGSAQVTSTALGAATVWVEHTLDAKVDGLGAVRYYGQPAVTQHVTSLAKVVAMGQK